jgi:FkbM family methyltransferase
MRRLMIAYAQNFEDVMIARLFEADYRGFYVDVGAAHPEYLSVTCHFYNLGWSGINVEPSFQFYPLLCTARPNDINLQCAVGEQPGRATFYEFPQFAENSTLNRKVADQIAMTGQSLTTHEVEVVRLADLCDMHVKERTIDFMKIDVEGSELGVLQGGDWTRYRPRLLIIEATAVNSREENAYLWESILIDAKYHKVWFDGLNSFYLREEDLRLRNAFQLPPNVFDGFVASELASFRQNVPLLQQKLKDQHQHLEDRQQQLMGLEASHERLCNAINHMSSIVGGRQVGGEESSLQTVTEGIRILTSRKATLSHFFALNIAWLRRMYLA